MARRLWPGDGIHGASIAVYRQLARLEERGWAQSVVDPRTTGPDAKLYTLTEEGLRVFQEWATAPYEPTARPMDPDFQVRITSPSSWGRRRCWS